MEIYLIRHGKTYGNTLSRYIGTTDEDLCVDGVAELQEIYKSAKYLSVSKVYTSNLKRTIQTANILFPDQEISIVRNLQECDFGEFENKNYIELNDNPNYQAWIDSNGTMPFPGGESREECASRQLQAFEDCVHELLQSGCDKAAFVVHGGTIMNIMERFCEEKKSFYDWHVKNGHGYHVQVLKDMSDTGFRLMVNHDI